MLNINGDNYERRVSSNAAKVLAAAGILNYIESARWRVRDESRRFAFEELRKGMIKKSHRKNPVRTYEMERDHGINQSCKSFCHNNVYGRWRRWTCIPDSNTIALSSWAMYWIGVPVGGLDLNWIRDLTTSANRDQKRKKGKHRHMG